MRIILGVISRRAFFRNGHILANKERKLLCHNAHVGFILTCVNQPAGFKREAQGVAKPNLSNTAIIPIAANIGDGHSRPWV